MRKWGFPREWGSPCRHITTLKILPKKEVDTIAPISIAQRKGALREDIHDNKMLTKHHIDNESYLGHPLCYRGLTNVHSGQKQLQRLTGAWEGLSAARKRIHSNSLSQKVISGYPAVDSSGMMVNILNFWICQRPTDGWPQESAQVPTASLVLSDIWEPQHHVLSTSNCREKGGVSKSVVSSRGSSLRRRQPWATHAASMLLPGLEKSLWQCFLIP